MTLERFDSLLTKIDDTIRLVENLELQLADAHSKLTDLYKELSDYYTKEDPVEQNKKKSE